MPVAKATSKTDVKTIPRQVLKFVVPGAQKLPGIRFPKWEIATWQMGCDLAGARPGPIALWP